MKSCLKVVNREKGKRTLAIFFVQNCNLAINLSKKNRKNKQQNGENDVSKTDGAAASNELVAQQDDTKMTGNMNLLKLKKALDEMSKVSFSSTIA